MTWQELINYDAYKNIDINVVLRAEEIVLATIGRLVAPTEEEIGTERYAWYMKSIYSQADYFDNYGTDEETSGQFSIGSYSESKNSNDLNSTGLTKRSMLYLNNSGLMYRGVQSINRVNEYEY